jgi:toxin-antitoxin system PIN domain toxin
MIVPDANLLVYAYDETAAAHRVARAWWEDALSGAEPVGIPWIVVLAFVRLMTHPTLSQNPMTIEQTRTAVQDWLALDHVRLLSPSTTTVTLFFELLDQAGTGGNLSTDAMIGALASEYGSCVYSNDRDFGRFPHVVWRNPLDRP